MEAFIDNHQLNIIRMEMDQILRLLKYSNDPAVAEVVIDKTQERIEGLFEGIDGEALDRLQMRHLKEEQDVISYMRGIEDLSFGMKRLTDRQIHKCFPKEKKLQLPADQLRDSRHTYLGWRDEGKNRLYLIGESGQGLKGLVCRINPVRVKNATMCALCGHISDGGDVVNVTVRCKGKDPAAYHVIGFNLCRDSQVCNRRLTDPDKLRRLVAKATNYRQL